MLLEQIKADQLQSRKNKNSLKTSLLTTLIGDAEMIGKNDGNRITTDYEVVAVVKKFIKNTTEFYENIKNTKSLKQSELLEEIKILNTYLPKQLSEQEIKCIITKEFGKIDKTQKGMIMKYFKEFYSGQYDGGLVSNVIG